MLPVERPRILLVDDDPALVRAVGTALTMIGGFSVQTELDGGRAVEIARTFRPDLILVDLIAGQWRGEEIAASLEADDELRSIPIAFLSGLISGHEQVDAHGHRLIPKAISPDEMIAIVREILNGPTRGALRSGADQ